MELIFGIILMLVMALAFIFIPTLWLGFGAGAAKAKGKRWKHILTVSVIPLVFVVLLGVMFAVHGDRLNKLEARIPELRREIVEEVLNPVHAETVETPDGKTWRIMVTEDPYMFVIMAVEAEQWKPAGAE